MKLRRYSFIKKHTGFYKNTFLFAIALGLYFPTIASESTLGDKGKSNNIPDANGYTLLFEENFDGDSLNTNMWKYRIDRRTGMGYMNGLNRAENVRVKDGKLYIDCRQEMVDGKLENTGGGIISTKNFGYGYYECLSRPFMGGHGVHTSFWQRGGANPNNDVFEIDSYEIDSKQFVATNNLYYVLGDKERKYVPWPHRAQIPFTIDEEGWFLDSYEYTPDGIIFYDNGLEVARTDKIELNAAQAIWLTALNGVGEVESDKQPCSSEFEYFRYYAKDYPGVNILSNGNFEFNQDKVDPTLPIAWNIIDAPYAFKIKNDGASRDKYYLHIGDEDKPFNATIKQCLSFILDGEYELSAMVRSNGKMQNAQLKALNSENDNLAVSAMNIPVSKDWTYISAPVTVKNNEIIISVEAKGEKGAWLDIDDIQFMKPSTDEAKREQKPFSLYNESVWQLGFDNPIKCPGDERFFFFDRCCGLGDSISVCFTLNADQRANMMPIARIPKEGNSGWAIQLTQDGGIIFRIGSVNSHTDVKAQDVYKPGTPVNISCVFENGSATIYANGKLLKKQKGIIHDTKDKTAAGRLGTVGEAYQAVGDVVLQTNKIDKETQDLKNFRGTLSNVAIYNKRKIN